MKCEDMVTNGRHSFIAFRNVICAQSGSKLREAAKLFLTDGLSVRFRSLAFARVERLEKQKGCAKFHLGD
jgi:hypothetical protein